MIELSEQDMANLVKAEQEWIASKNDSRYVLREYCYRAGLAAGIERAAKHMESESTNTAIKIRSLLK